MTAKSGIELILEFQASLEQHGLQPAKILGFKEPTFTRIRQEVWRMRWYAGAIDSPDISGFMLMAPGGNVEVRRIGGAKEVLLPHDV